MFTVYRNDTATAMTCVVAAEGKGCTDDVHAVHFAEGDKIALVLEWGTHMSLGLLSWTAVYTPAV
jgi:hypothetical protein